MQLAGSQTVELKLAERGTRLSNGLWVRQIRELSATATQSSILSTDMGLDLTRIAARMAARWSQENFLKYMREHYGLDRLIEYGTQPLPEAMVVVNPAWRRLHQSVRKETAQLYRLQVDTIKLIAYRAESALVGEAREALARDDDARALLRRLFVTPANLRPDPPAKTLTVQLHRLGSPLQDAAVAHLYQLLTDSETLFPTTNLRLISRQVGST